MNYLKQWTSMSSSLPVSLGKRWLSLSKDHNLVIQFSLGNSPRFSKITLVRKTGGEKRPGLPWSGPWFLHYTILTQALRSSLSPRPWLPQSNSDYPTLTLISRVDFPRGLEAHSKTISQGYTERKHLKPKGAIVSWIFRHPTRSYPRHPPMRSHSLQGPHWQHENLTLMSPNNIRRLSRNIFEHDYVPDAVPKIKELVSTSW